MQPVDVFEFIQFGVHLQTLSWGWVMSETLHRDYAAQRVRELAAFRDKWLMPRNVGVELVNRVIADVESAIRKDDVRSDWKSDEARDRTVEPPEVDWRDVFEIAALDLGELLTVLEHECPKFPILSVQPVRAFDTTVLMKSAERALSITAQKRLSEFWLEGWREAGRCLAFDAPTAATFQMLRVTEGVIKKYRKVVTQADAGAADTLSDHINALKKACVSEAVIAALRALKNAHRNPTMHPGKNATLDEAIGLFGICTSVIDFIDADMDARDRARSALAIATDAS